MSSPDLEDFDKLDKQNFVSLKLDENIVYFGEVRLVFLARPEQAPVDTSKVAAKKKPVKKGEVSEDTPPLRDIYLIYKEFDGKMFQKNYLEEPTDLKEILENEYIQLIKEGIGSIVFYQINEEILSKFEGEWVNDKMMGRAKITYPNKSQYVGAVKNSERNGFGMLEWPTGQRYSGQWIDNKMQGYGVFLTEGDIIFGLLFLFVEILFD